MTNSYSDIVTCVVPQDRGHSPSVRPVKASGVEYRFHALSVRLLDGRAGALEDRVDFEAKHPRATPEKALLDWIHLGASPRTRIAGPPLDIDAERLDVRRVRRLAKAMGLTQHLDAYFARKAKYDRSPDVEANASVVRKAVAE